VSYLLEHEAGTVFHGGDTKPGEVFEDVGRRYDVDLGIVAFGSVGTILDKETREPVRTKWYCDENEAVEVASTVRCDRLLPSHWDMWKGLTADPKALHEHASSFEYPRRLDVAEVGDRVDL
jgi:L-ascorbate 6-phosphate lactonase